MNIEINHILDNEFHSDNYDSHNGKDKTAALQE